MLQINKVTNVSAPSYNPGSEHAPRLLALTLTDGHASCNAVEMVPLSVFRCVCACVCVCVCGWVRARRGGDPHVRARVSVLCENRVSPVPVLLVHVTAKERSVSNRLRASARSTSLSQ